MEQIKNEINMANLNLTTLIIALNISDLNTSIKKWRLVKPEKDSTKNAKRK